MTNANSTYSPPRNASSHYSPSREANRYSRPIQIPLPGKEFNIHEATPTRTVARGAAAASQGGA